MAEINFQEIEKKWQDKWENEKAFKTSEDSQKPKYYILEMFPYPSGTGLHMGHAFNYIIGDIQARFRRMIGYNVLYPMGYDSFGLPAENAAIKAGEHPKNYTENSTKNFEEQQRGLGLSYDWDRKFKTSDKEYYKWNQYFFIKLLEQGLAYKKKSPVNWCPDCNTVLANEQVKNGKCWRHDETDIEIRHLDQWFIKTTAYADELLDKIDDLEWPERIKAMQKNWIGRSKGAEIYFDVNGEKWPVFTTRPDTLYGVTFLTISAQHEKLNELVTKEQKEEVDKFLEKVKSVSEKPDTTEGSEKEGAFTGSYAKHPLTGEDIPIYTGNFVLSDYGSGMVMAVPAHDQRDFEFAEKYSIPIKVVVEPTDYEIYERNGQIPRAYEGEGTLTNSEGLKGLKTDEAKERIIGKLEEDGLGKSSTQYKLKDWLISRQRYWGTPIPVVNCENCGQIPEKEENLPIELPDKVEFGKGNPLETNEEWIKTSCPECGKEARRETDTMDTFFDSSWYFLRYTDTQNDKEPFDRKKADHWMPVDQYIGGDEHACMHLIYARFFTKFLRDLGFVSIDEPFSKLFSQGMVLGPDGNKMSKSKGNVRAPEEISGSHGIDTARMFVVSVASPDKDVLWSDEGANGSLRFVKRVFNFISEFNPSESSKKLKHHLNKSIKEVTEDIENFKYNLAIIKIRELFEIIENSQGISKEDLETFVKLLNPFCPHITEEFWEMIGNEKFVSLSNWPEADENAIDEFFDQQEEKTQKAASDAENVLNMLEEREGKKNSVYIYTLPKEKDYYEASEIERKTGKLVKIFGVNEGEKYDPQNVSKKAKPGKPAIYVE